MPDSFNSSDYVPALLELLYDLNKPISADEIHNEFRRKYAANIPPDHYEYIPSGTLPRWIKNIDWARHVLKEIGLLEPKGRGVSQISESGRQWADDNREVSWESRRKSLWDRYNETRLSGRQRTGNITELTDAAILARARPIVEQVKSMVKSTVNSHPVTEIPWLIEFCYRMGMYQEGVALLGRLDQSSLSEGDFARVKRIAYACQLKLG